jgi:hypothetical protein
MHAIVASLYLNNQADLVSPPDSWKARHHLPMAGFFDRVSKYLLTFYRAISIA